GRESILEVMPPWQGGGEMIAQVSFSGTTYNQLPFKFEAGTPNISGVLGLSAAVDWLSLQDRTALDNHEQALFQHALECCATIPGFIRIGAPEKSVSLVSFQLDQHHQQDIGLQLDQMGIAVRTGHHCAMPLMQALGLNGTTRASFAFYNTMEEVERFATALDQIAREDQVQVAVAAVEEDDPAFSQSPYGTEISADDLLAKLGPMKDWNSRYRELMLLGKQLPKLADKFKSDDNRVQGCESQTWLAYKKDSNGIYHFLADSDARVIRGLIALVLAAFNHKSAEEINAFDINNYFDQLDLQRHLSPSRGNGLRAIVEKIRQIAADAN
ncbi:cysteine desulfurase sulfur acceptor subunit CsdE, partial [Pontibacterium sp.]